MSRSHFEDNVEPICTLPYTKKLYEVMKSFMNIIFGGRRHSIQIKCLEIPGEQIIRLPEGVKFYVDELKLTRDLDLISRVISPVLDESCIPIRHLNKYVLDELDHPFMKNAQEITFFYPGREQKLFEVFQTLPHLKMNCPREHYEFSQREFIFFIKNTLKNKEKRIGARYQLGFKNKEKVTKLLVAIKNQCKEVVIQFDNENVILQMENSKQMDVCCIKNHELLSTARYPG